MEGCSWRSVVTYKVGAETTCQHFQPWGILKETTEPAGPFGTMPQEPWHPGKSAEPDHVIQFNCGEVCTHASYIKEREHGRNSTTEEQKWSMVNS